MILPQRIDDSLRGMGLLESVKTMVETSDVTLYECRNCGRTLEADADECPICGNREIAYYEW